MRARKLAVSIAAAASAVALGVAIPVAAQAGTSDAPTTASKPAIAPPAPGQLPAGATEAATKSTEGRANTANACWYDGKWWCNNIPGAALLTTDHSVVGHVETNPSIFVCRDDSGADHGGPHPTRWVYTQADDTGAWGWMSDNDISSETDTLPVC